MRTGTRISTPGHQSSTWMLITFCRVVPSMVSTCRSSTISTSSVLGSRRLGSGTALQKWVLGDQASNAVKSGKPVLPSPSMSPSGVSQPPSSETRSVNPVQPSWSRSVEQDEPALAISTDNTQWSENGHGSPLLKVLEYTPVVSAHYAGRLWFHPQQFDIGTILAMLPTMHRIMNTFRRRMPCLLAVRLYCYRPKKHCEQGRSSTTRWGSSVCSATKARCCVA